MDKEARNQINADMHERTSKRKPHRNGKREISLKTSDGELPLDKPLISEFPLESHISDRYSEVEKAVESAILESYIQGVSRRM